MADQDSVFRLDPAITIKQKTAKIELYRKSRASFCQLNGPAATILMLCDGSRTIQTIADELCRLYRDANALETRDTALAIIEQLRQMNVVVECSKGSDQNHRVKAKNRNIGMRRNRKCTQLFIVFNGAGTRRVEAGLSIITKGGINDRNYILLTDPYKCHYQLGIDSCPRDFANTLKNIDEKISAAGDIQEIYTLGVSNGGFAAIVAGHYLKAKCVFAMAPVTYLEDKVIRVRFGDSFVYQIKGEHGDLREVLKQSNGKTEYQLFYGERHARDAAQVKRMAGVPGVQTIAVPTERHLTFQLMAKLGYAKKIFPHFR